MSALDDERDSRWVKGVRSGDAEAFEALFRAYCEPLCDFVYSHVFSRGIAEDLVHDIFCDLWNRRRDWRPRVTVKAYLYRAARNKALNWLKHHRVRQTWEADERRRKRPVSESPAEAAQYRELTRAMQRAIEELPARRRLVYTMVRQQDMTYVEVAAALDISSKTVENQMGRALKVLRARLSAFREEEGR